VVTNKGFRVSGNECGKPAIPKNEHRNGFWAPRDATILRRVGRGGEYKEGRQARAAHAGDKIVNGEVNLTGREGGWDRMTSVGLNSLRTVETMGEQIVLGRIGST